MKTVLHISVILLLLAIILFQHGCHSKKESELNSRITLLTLDSTSLTKQVNKKGDTIAIIQAGLVQSQKQLNALTNDLFATKQKLGNTIAYYKTHVKVRIDSFETSYVRVDTLPVYITDSFARENMVMTPAWFVADGPYYSISGAVRKKGVDIYDMEVRDTLTGRFVEGKKKLFKPRSIEHQVMNANPYVSITGGQAVVYQPKNDHRLLKGILIYLAGILTHLILK